MLVPWEFVSRMEPGNPRDPLLLQVLVDPAEQEMRPGDLPDPVGDRAALQPGGLIQKYHGRALLVVHAQCAAHCRYCFRRTFPYAVTGPAAWTSAFRQLAVRTEIEELILSGGDPLTLSDHRLAQLVSAACELPHLRRLRIHTRLPVLIPQRVTSGLLQVLTGSRLQPWMVIHVNHPREIDDSVARSLRWVRSSGIPLLNQSVLLRGVNDDLATLTDLSRALIDLGVIPYYLHQLDRVTGAGHFEVPVSRGRALVRQLRRQLPGYAVPRYVRDQPGSACKTVLV
jgi:EF-P beta-lysylation protein EpmB